MEKARVDAHRRETWGTFAAQFRWGKVSPVHGRHVVSDIDSMTMSAPAPE